MNENWKFEGGNKLFISNNISLNSCNKRIDLFCNVRNKLLSVNDLDVLSKKFIPFKIFEIVQLEIDKLEEILLFTLIQIMNIGLFLNKSIISQLVCTSWQLKIFH